MSTTFIPNNDFCSRQQNTQLVVRVLLSLIVSCTLKKEEVYSSEMSMNFYRTTRRHMRYYSTLYGNKICEFEFKCYDTLYA
jgi:hypothetical protein